MISILFFGRSGNTSSIANKRKNIVVGNERALRAKRAWTALHQAVSNEVLTDLNAFAQKRRHFLYVTSIQPHLMHCAKEKPFASISLLS